jgi:hypothetical protein
MLWVAVGFHGPRHRFPGLIAECLLLDCVGAFLSRVDGRLGLRHDPVGTFLDVVDAFSACVLTQSTPSSTSPLTSSTF